VWEVKKRRKEKEKECRERGRRKSVFNPVLA
jgi:hypothetical protein